MTLSTGHPSVGRSLPWGVALVLFYLVAAGVRYGPETSSGRLLLDGMAPLAPYRWLRPPSELARGNQLPAAGAATLALGPSGVPAASVATDDGQATVSLNDNVIGPQAGESSVRVMITPIDPASVAPPPARQHFWQKSDEECRYRGARRRGIHPPRGAVHISQASGGESGEDAQRFAVRDEHLKAARVVGALDGRPV